MRKRRTRKQKIIADLRNKLSMVQTQLPSPELRPQPAPLPSYTHHYQTPAARPLIKTISYDFVKKDLIKTGILSSSILLIELLLFFLLKNNLISLPFLNSY